MVHNRTGKRTRLISCTGGGWTTITSAVGLGIVEPLNLRPRRNPYETLYKLTLGGWPADVEDPTSPLVSPAKQTSWADVGGIVLDDLTTTARWVMSRTLEREAQPPEPGKEAWRVSAQEAAAKFEDGDLWFSGGGAKAHYGTIQQQMEAFVAQLCSITGRYIMCTALETKGKDPSKGYSIYTPDLIGDAVNGYIPSWFKNTVHLQVIGGEHHMFLKAHADQGSDIPYMAKTRASAGFEMPLVLKGAEASVENLMNLLEKSHEVGLNSLKERLVRR